MLTFAALSFIMTSTESAERGGSSLIKTEQSMSGKKLQRTALNTNKQEKL